MRLLSPSLVADAPVRTVQDEWTPSPDERTEAVGLAELLRPFERAFRRRDQVQWFTAYIRGLLQPESRKTIEAMVRSLDGQFAASISDPSQALQNFLNQSPWDERFLWKELRDAVAERFGSLDVVVAEVGIVKQGQHSVGVQRQYAGDSDRKQNCQIAIVLFASTPLGAAPIGCRLYLPKNWSGDERRLASAGVPVEHRSPASRGQVALGLLDDVKADGLAVRTVIAAPRHTAARDLRDGLELRRLPYIVGVDGDFAVRCEPRPGVPSLGGQNPARPIRDIAPSEPWTPFGLSRFAGLRLVPEDALESRLQPWAFIEHVDDGRRKYFLGQLDGSFASAQAGPLLSGRNTSHLAVQSLKTRFGLDHFEGRSWRGFHHHAALVALAYWLAASGTGIS